MVKIRWERESDAAAKQVPYLRRKHADNEVDSLGVDSEATRAVSPP